MADYKGCEPQKQTNYDRIKAMSVKELAEFLNKRIRCETCAYGNNGICYSPKRKCLNGVLDWLKSEVKE